MKSDRLPVAIIGGGFSGTILAAQLAKRGIASLLIEGGGRTARGTAFSTEEAVHLLNVRADNMSAWADDPEHFARLVESEGGDRRGFAERRRFGRYLGAILEDAVASGLVTIEHGRAASARPDGDHWSVELADGSSRNVSAVVLAIGNQPPEPLPNAPAGSQRFVADPWGPDAKRAVAEAAVTGEDVLVIGTGLTMVDTVLSLDAAGHRGAIVALSRRGLVPRGHSDFAPAPVEQHEVPHGDLRAAWRWLRRQGARVGWRAAIDSLRPYSHGLWQSLSHDQQHRFLRHARPWWDVHRHRIAPEVASRIHELVAEGRLEIVAGRLLEVRDQDDRLVVRYRRRGSESERERSFGYAINCTGPLGQIGRTRDPLLRQLLDDGLACPDQLGIGLEVDERSRVAGAGRLWALGPLTKGRYWEIIAVPDIRVQAADIADDIAKELSA